MSYFICRINYLSHFGSKPINSLKFLLFLQTEKDKGNGV